MQSRKLLFLRPDQCFQFSDLHCFLFQLILQTDQCLLQNSRRVRTGRILKRTDLLDGQTCLPVLQNQFQMDYRFRIIQLVVLGACPFCRFQQTGPVIVEQRLSCNGESFAQLAKYRCGSSEYSTDPSFPYSS